MENPMPASPRRPLVAGNWKMHGLRRSAAELAKMIQGAAELAGKVDLMVCPPATLLMSFAEAARGSPVAIGGQDCHPEAAGAYTGDLAAEMLADAGAAAVIVGHSERRTLHQDALVRAKAQAAWRAGLVAIVCIGETQDERNAGRTLAVLDRQLADSLPEGGGGRAGNLVIAYEPVWAIGTGVTPTPADVAEAHGFIRQRLRERFGETEMIRILYGGSVKPANAAQLLRVAHVDGALVGGASLKAEDFLQIARVYL